MIKNEFREILERRKQIHSESYHELQKCWDEMTEILSKNINETINFLENECSVDEFSWMSEIFENIATKTQSKEFIKCLYKVADRFPEECKKYNILESINFADGAIFVCDVNKMIKEFRLAFKEQENTEKKCFDKFVNILTKNMDQTNYFIEYECDFQEFYFISKFSKDIVKQTQNVEFILNLKKKSKKYNMESNRYKINDFIKEAEKCIIKHG